MLILDLFIFPLCLKFIWAQAGIVRGDQKNNIGILENVVRCCLVVPHRRFFYQKMYENRKKRLETVVNHFIEFINFTILFRFEPYCIFKV